MPSAEAHASDGSCSCNQEQCGSCLRVRFFGEHAAVGRHHAGYIGTGGERSEVRNCQLPCFHSEARYPHTSRAHFWSFVALELHLAPLHPGTTQPLQPNLGYLTLQSTTVSLRLKKSGCYAQAPNLASRAGCSLLLFPAKSDGRGYPLRESEGQTSKPLGQMQSL